MRLFTAATLLACAASKAQAFSDSSPFVLFSTADLPNPDPSSTTQLQTASQVLTNLKSLLASCPTSRYILVSQPNMHASDLRDELDGHKCHMPNLCAVQQQPGSDGNRKTTGWAVAEVVGQVSGRPIEAYVKQVCGEKGREARIERVELRHLPAVSEKGSAGREEVLGDNDHELGKMLGVLDDDYTVMVFSDPNEFKPYEPEFAEPVHMDLRRWAEEPEVVASMKSNSTANPPLFEKYQFFTPGIFMAFIVLAVILSILGVGLKALASLEVSYGAFDKEMGPAAQKKQM
ncbi:hypothetical protein VTI74DRAFT_7890 [Chaetomium olivicolor]